MITRRLPGHASAFNRNPSALARFSRVAGMLAFSLLCLFGAAPSVRGAPAPAGDYERRVMDIPMRDGVTLHTVLLIPRGAVSYPILLNRTPFDAEHRFRAGKDRLEEALPPIYTGLVRSGYIFVFQDVRGRGGSGGDYVVTRPVAGPLNPSGVDHVTDAWDTIDWLVRHVPESNGRVGMLGTSYDGFTVLMALVKPHPALKAAVSINPLVDGWKGDDWFHNGAFRQVSMLFAYYFGGPAAQGREWPAGGDDDYDTVLKVGSAGSYAKMARIDDAAFWRSLTDHPAYDAFWRGRAVDRLLAKASSHVPTLHVASLWDQEDIYGAVHAYEAMERFDKDNRDNFLVIGPWWHGQPGADGTETGPLRWSHDTSAYFREQILRPFLDDRLKGTGRPRDLQPVTAFETGTGAWRSYDRWPRSRSGGPGAKGRLYLSAGGRLHFGRAKGAPGFDSYVSDPANPVPYSPRPIKLISDMGENWPTWLLEDQRAVSRRPDVLTYVSDPLSETVEIGGEPLVNLIASTSGSDSDWVVKLIDVYPEGEAAGAPALSGYELAVSMDIFRGRYRVDPAKPQPLAANQPLHYRFALPTTHHAFLPGHRIMVQIQSSWFPLYDRNPQRYVDNIFLADAADYQAATQRIYRAGARASFIELPVMAGEASKPRSKIKPRRTGAPWSGRSREAG